MRRFRPLLFISLLLLVAAVVAARYHAATNHHLLVGVWKQDVPAIGTALAHGAEVDARQYPADKTVPVYNLAGRFKFVRPPYGMTALMIATINHDYPTAKYLLEHGADVNAVSSEFDARQQVTALWLARLQYQFLTKLYADPKLRRKAKDKPSDFLPIITLLEQAGGKA